MNRGADDPIRVEDTVLILLAAGRSTRFGDAESKLTQDFLNRPLGLHAALALEDLPFAGRLAILGSTRLDYAACGFTEIHNDDPGEGMARSIRLGVARARERGARAVLVVLADMPRITAGHVLRLFDAAAGSAGVVASSDGRAPMPPVLFGAEHFDTLLALTGDAGARVLVEGGRHVFASPAELIDIDTPGQLERLRAAVTRGGARRSG